MSVKDKIRKAKPTDWKLLKIPRWKLKFLIWWAKVKVKFNLYKG